MSLQKRRDMERLYFVRSSFSDREAAWAHFEAHWAEDNPQVARKLDWEGVKTSYETAVYLENRWYLIREVVDYTEHKPSPGSRPKIGECPVCKKGAVVQRGDFFVPESYVHLMGKEESGKEIPLNQHFMQPVPPGAVFEV